MLKLLPRHHGSLRKLSGLAVRARSFVCIDQNELVPRSSSCLYFSSTVQQVQERRGMRRWPRSGHRWPVQRFCQSTLAAPPATAPGIAEPTQDGARTRDKLPLPPIMDPEFIAAREKHRTPKPRQDLAELTEFQKKLYANPHAQALASPIRNCNYSATRLPEHFLLGLRATKPEGNHRSWLLPTTLLTKDHQIPKMGPASFVLLRDPLLRAIANSRDRVQRCLDINTRRQLGGQASKVIWRQDMAEFVQKLLCAQVVRRLRWQLTHLDARRIVVVPPSERSSPRLTPNDAASAVLQLLPTFSPAVRELSMRAESSADVIATELVPEFAKINASVRTKMPRNIAHLLPSPHIPVIPNAVRSLRLGFPTFKVEDATVEGEEDGQAKGGQVSLYPLYELLGREAVAELVEGTPAQGATWIVLKSHTWNLGVEMMLSKLQGYLADRKL